MNDFENLLAKSVRIFGVIYITKLIFFSITKDFHCFVNTDDTNGIIQMLKVNQSIGEVGHQSLFIIAANDVSYNIKSLTIKLNKIAESNEVILLGSAMFESDTSEVNGRYLYRANLECGSANGVEVTKVFDVGLQAATVRKGSNTIINKDIRVRPFSIVLYTPTSKFFVLKFTILSQERNGENGIGEHILSSYFSNNFHKEFLELADFIDCINHKCSIGEFGAAEEGFEVRSVKY